MERIKAEIAKARKFLREVGGELSKVIWPTRERTLKLTGVVVIMVAVIMGYLFLLDLPMGLALEKIVAR